MNGARRTGMLKALGVGALVLGLAGPAVGQGPPANNPGQPFAQLQATLADIQAQLNALGGGLDLSALQMQLNNLTTDVSNLSTDVSNLQASLDDLSIEVDLRGVTQNWDKKLDATNGDANGCNSDRFTCLFGDTVVRDNETGLVWERDPDTGTRTWSDSIFHCANREVGGRKGWSLPMREQLATLVDPSNSNPALPTGHPFLNVQSANYWSASTFVKNPDTAWLVSFRDGPVHLDIKGSDSHYAWCVRGGQVYDGQDVEEVIEEIADTHP